MSVEACPPPWDYIVGKTLFHVETRHDNPLGAGLHICSIPKAKEANAELIVRAVNSHAELVAALEAFAEYVRENVVPSSPSSIGEYAAMWEKYNAALAKAKGQL